MQQRGIVVKIDGQYAHVKIRRQAACGSNCASCAGCEVSQRTAKVYNHKGAKIGDNVQIEISSKNLLYAAFLLYILPLLSGFLAGATFYFVTLSEPLSITAGIIFFILIYYIIYKYNKKISNNEKFIGTITKIFY